MMRLRGGSSERVSLVIGLPMLLMMCPGLARAANSTLESPEIEMPVNGAVSQQDAAKKVDKSAAAKFADLAVASCFEHGEDKAGLEALARTSGWKPVGAAERKKNSGAASSMLAGWTFEGKSGAVAVMLSQENVTPPVYVCSLTAKITGTQTYEDVRSVLQSQLKTNVADQSETGGQTKTTYWVRHTQTCEALVTIVHSGSPKLITVRMLHGRNRPAARE